MKENQIDRLFQEKLKDLEATPNKKVWRNIESKLNKKKRRALPMWWFSGSVAAILILGLLFFPFSNNSVLDNEIINEPVIKFQNKKPQTPTIVKKDIDTTIPLNKEKIKETINSKSKLLITKNKKIEEQKNLKEIAFLTAQKQVQKIEKEKDSVVDKNAMKKIFLAEVSQLAGNKKADSLLSYSKKKLTETPKKNFLASIEKENDNVKEKKISDSEWVISPVVAILNSNSFSKASPIDNSLSNSTVGNNSYSYGIQIGYQINKKWTIQSGIHLQEISFSNNQVAIISKASMNNNSNVSFEAEEAFSFQDSSPQETDNQGIGISSIGSLVNVVSLNGKIDQKYGYIEVPVEVKYNVIDGKNIQTKLVAGFSSLFLNKNTIDLSANSFLRSGEATNLNNINFSGNFGIDFSFKFNKNWSFNLNPMLKAQLNTFKENSNGFSPYFIGVYTGINFNF